MPALFLEKQLLRDAVSTKALSPRVSPCDASWKSIVIANSPAANGGEKNR